MTAADPRLVAVASAAPTGATAAVWPLTAGADALACPWSVRRPAVVSLPEQRPEAEAPQPV